MIKKISNILRTLLGEGRDLQNRLMCFCLLAGAIMSVLTMLENLIISADALLIVQMLAVLAIMGISLILVFWNNKVEAVASIAIPLLVYVVFPYIFFSSGGIHGGAPGCLLVGIVFIFVL